MRAVIYDRYGPPEVQRLEEVEPPLPKDDEVLVKIHATTVNRTDCEIRDANRRNGWAVMLLSRLLTGLLRPKQRILGSELAGEVVAVGAAVRDFAVGDRVFGVNAWTLGAHAEYICMRESGALAPMPAGVTFAEAAAVCDGGMLALQGLRSAHLRQGQRFQRRQFGRWLISWVWLCFRATATNSVESSSPRRLLSWPSPPPS